MTTFRRRAAAVAAATSVVLLGTAAAASAQTVTLRDARHDVWQTTDAGQTFTAAPNANRADVTKVTARYTRKSFVVTQHFTRLDRVDSGDVYTLAVRTSGHLRRLVFVQAVNVDWSGIAWVDNARKKKVRCAGVAEHINYTRNTVRVSVPATCLKSPRWVQFTAFDLHIASKDLFYGDNPMNTQAEPRAWSPRVHRG